MLRALYAEDALSPIFRLVDWAYSDPTSLLLKTRNQEIFSVIQSESGTRQGDPFGMLLFCLGIKQAINTALRVGGSEVRAIAIADDVTFVGPADGRSATIATAKFRQETSRLGLVFRGEKSKLLNFSNATLDPIALNFARVHRIPVITDATVLLGTPMGSDNGAVQRLALAKVAEGASFFEALQHPLMPSSIADRLLRFCGTPRQVYLSRVGFPNEYSQALSEFDSQVDRAGARLLGEPSDARPRDRAQAAMPIRHAGLAYTKANTIASCAFLGAAANASYALIAALPNGLPRHFSRALTDALTHVHGCLRHEDTIGILPPITCSSIQFLQFFGTPETRNRAFQLQRRISRKLTQRAAELELLTASPLRKACIRAAKAKWASQWLTMPNSDNDNMLNAAFQQAARMRCGLPPAPHMPSHCHCGVNLLNDAYHCLSHSAGNSEAIQGHNNIAKVIAREVRRAGGKAWIEPRFQLPGQDDEHTDIRIALGAELIYVDVSIVHPTSASYLSHSIAASLGAARQAEIRKNRQYLERARREHASFVPFIIETYGGFGSAARKLVNKLANYATTGSELWSSRDVKQKILQGVFEELHLRNLRMMSAQLNRCHRPPPPRSGRSRTQPRQQTQTRSQAQSQFTANPRGHRRSRRSPPVYATNAPTLAVQDQPEPQNSPTNRHEQAHNPLSSLNLAPLVVDSLPLAHSPDQPDPGPTNLDSEDTLCRDLIDPQPTPMAQDQLLPSLNNATSFVNGRSDERLTDSVIDPETSLASERVLGSGHVEPDSTPDQNPQLIDYEAEAEAFCNASAQPAGGVGDPAHVVETSVLDHIHTPDPTPERT
jgi:hypothetical protein